MSKFHPMDDNTPKDRWLLLLLHGQPIPRAVVGGFFPECNLIKGGTWCHAIVPKSGEGFLGACVPIGWMEVEFDVEDPEPGTGRPRKTIAEPDLIADQEPEEALPRRGSIQGCEEAK